MLYALVTVLQFNLGVYLSASESMGQDYRYRQKMVMRESDI